ncbi:MAG: outer membrane lipoprotein carrier protein LolA [Planctomycetes bacterium]|nr:outer membrane lipoprotein carrier protein LolA [Planctomycetota bacterium]
MTTLTTRFLLALASFALVATAVPTAAQQSPSAKPPDVATVLRDLESTFAALKTVRTQFVQEKELAVFRQKIVLKGEIALQNPGRLAWHVHAPLRYSIVVSGNEIRQWDEDADRIATVSLSSNPVLTAAIKHLQVWFGGKYTSLTGEYAVEILSLEPATSLAFVPRKGTVAQKTIKRVTVQFRPDRRYVKEILVEEVNGDRTRLEFVKVVLNEPIPPDIWKLPSRA